MKINLRPTLFFLSLLAWSWHGNVLAAANEPQQVMKNRFHLPASSGGQARTASGVELLDSVYTWAWDTATMAYQSDPYEKTTDILFDAFNNKTGETFQSWNGSAWVNVSRKSYTFLNGIYPSGTMVESWNGSAWENASLNTITYNLNNYPTSELAQTW